MHVPSLDSLELEQELELLEKLQMQQGLQFRRKLLELNPKHTIQNPKTPKPQNPVLQVFEFKKVDS